MKQFLFLSLFTFFFASSAWSQQTSPESVALDLSQAYKHLDFDRVAEMMHPEALNNLQEMVLDIMALDSTGSVAIIFTGETDPAIIQNLHPQTSFSRFMEGLIQLQPEMAHAFTSLETEAIGHIMEGESLAHVVTRGKVSMMGTEVEHMEIMTMKRHNDGWLAMLSGDINNMAQAFRTTLGGDLK